MKSIVEHVEEFIEGWFDGSIIFYNVDPIRLTRGTTWVSEHDQEAQSFANEKRIALSSALEKYVKKGKDNALQAGEIYASVLVLRGYGMIKNNPDSLKEINFYKQGYYDELKENDRLRDNLKEKLLKIEELQKIIEAQQKVNPIAK